MDKGCTSWIKRTKFSHTLYYRIDSSRIVFIPIKFRVKEIQNFELSPQATSLHKKSKPNMPLVVPNLLINNQRSISPLPATPLPDTFKEARSESKRFSTPLQRRKERQKRTGQYSSTDASDGMPTDSGPLRNISSFKGFGSITMKNFSWSNFFHHAGDKVTAVEAVDDHMIDLARLEVGDKFAHGANSRLYHAEYKGEPAAVKLMYGQDNDETGFLASQLEKHFTCEVTSLARLRHPNVIKILTAWKQPPFYFIVTEYLSEGSLRGFLNKIEHTVLPLHKIIGFALQIARGMEYVHSQGVIHRDLKPENILIDQDFHLKIADFGIACEEVHCQTFAGAPGTYRWMAPEMIKRKRYGRKVDVYSFGLILWAMVSGRIPYEEMPSFVAAFAVVYKNQRPAFSKDCPAAMKVLIEHCWSVQPEKRPEFWQIVKVLEEFESSLAHDGTLKLVQSSICPDQRKGFLHWIRKLSPPRTHSTSVPKPKFM